MADGRTHAKVNKRVVTFTAPPVIALAVSSNPLVAISTAIFSTAITAIFLLSIDSAFKYILNIIFYSVLSVGLLLLIAEFIPLNYITLSVATAYLGGLFFGYLITPDSDQEGVTFGEREVGRILSWPFKQIFRGANSRRKLEDMFTLIAKVFMYPYALFIDHRSPHSHLTAWGDFWRILYVILGLCVLISVPIMIYYNLTFDFMGAFISEVFSVVFSAKYLEEKVAFFVGSCIMSFSHLAMDGFGIKWGKKK